MLTLQPVPVPVPTRRLRRVYALVDARHGLQQNDKDFFKVLNNAGTPFQVVLTKTDKVKPEQVLALKQALELELYDNYIMAKPVVLPTSSVSNNGVAELRAAVLLATEHIRDENEPPTTK